VYLIDVREFTAPKVKRLRYVDEQTWFPEQRERHVDPFFHTLLQESFYHGYLQLGILMSEHKMLHWGALRVSTGGEPILPFFGRYPGLPELLVEERQYVQEWVRVFYATLFIGEDRKYIMFMFNKKMWSLNKQSLARYLGVTLPDEPYSLHFHTYGDAESPRRSKEMMFPSDEDISILFQQMFLPGTLRTLEWLTPVAKVIHFALKQSLLFRVGYSEGIMALQ